jgi:hypothetical protein
MKPEDLKPQSMLPALNCIYISDDDPSCSKPQVGEMEHDSSLLAS